jgi:rhodanese-related sulfurtransferase
MDDKTLLSISPDDLYARLGTAASPLVLDVRNDTDFDADSMMLAGALRRTAISSEHSVVVYCVHGHEVSREAAAALRRRGVDAACLEGGIEAWKARNFPVRLKRDTARGGTVWITRERPKIDRIACPWLVSRFIDPDATFVYVPKDRVAAQARETGAIPYDIDGVEFTHEGERCSFDTILRLYGISSEPLSHLARIVRGADTSRHDLEPQCAGLFAISLGLSRNFDDDHAMLAHGLTLYDALYTWCLALQDETHNWPAQPGKQANKQTSKPERRNG